MAEPTLPPGIKLAPLEAFDPKAFIDSDPDSQRVCDFVLGLALIFNDLNDFMWAQYVLRKDQPDMKNFFRSPNWGMYLGVDLHCFRRKIAILHELSVFIRGSKRETSHPLFQTTLDTIVKVDPAFSWDSILTPPEELDSFLKNIRDKVSNHYYHTGRGDQNVLGEGYRKFFAVPDNKPALISYNKTALDTRFYFVDASIQGLMEIKDWRSMSPALSEHLGNVCLTLSAVILGFIVNRGYRLSEFTPPT